MFQKKLDTNYLTKKYDVVNYTVIKNKTDVDDSTNFQIS